MTTKARKKQLIQARIKELRTSLTKHKKQCKPKTLREERSCAMVEAGLKDAIASLRRLKKMVVSD